MSTENRKAQVVMLATKETIAGNMLCIDKKSNNLHMINPDENFDIPQHLYFLYDEEIKEDDWCLIDNNVGISTGYQILKCDKSDSKNGWYYFGDMKTGRCKKIIATTNPELNWIKDKYKIQAPLENLPRPSDKFIQKFIEEYNKGNIITEVMVEYEEYKIKGFAGGEGFQLKIAPDNTITIHPVEKNSDLLFDLIFNVDYQDFKGNSEMGPYIGDFREYLKKNYIIKKK